MHTKTKYLKEKYQKYFRQRITGDRSTSVYI